MLDSALCYTPPEQLDHIVRPYQMKKGCGCGSSLPPKRREREEVSRREASIEIHDAAA